MATSTKHPKRSHHEHHQNECQSHPRPSDRTDAQYWHRRAYRCGQRRRSPNASCCLRARFIARATSIMAIPRWISTRSNNAKASRSRRPRSPRLDAGAPGSRSRLKASGIGSISSIRRATWISPRKWSARCACSTARSLSSPPWKACNRNRRPFGGRPRVTACRAWPSSTKWTESARTLIQSSRKCAQNSARMSGRCSSPLARKTTCADRSM